jgi:hypothetical protein
MIARRRLPFFRFISVFLWNLLFCMHGSLSDLSLDHFVVGLAGPLPVEVLLFRVGLPTATTCFVVQ